MYGCYICNSVLPDILAYRAHLQRLSGVGDIILPIRCCQDNCKSTFLTIFNLMRHNKSYHVNDGLTTSVSADKTTSIYVEQLDSNCAHGFADKCGKNANADAEIAPIESMREEAVSVVAMLRAKGNVPYCVMPEIISSVNDMCGHLLCQVEHDTVNSLMESGVDPLTVGKVVHKIQQHRKPLSFLETAYKQDKFFENHTYAVCP